MLQGIRDRSSKWITWVILVLIAISFTFWGIHNYSGRSPDTTVAKVNGSKISRGEWDQVYQRMQRQMQFQLGAQYNASQSAEAKLRRDALEQLINAHLLQQSAQRSGFRASNQQAQATIMSMPAFQVDGKFSEGAFNNVLNTFLYTPQTFIQEVQNDIVINQLQSGLMASAFVLPNEVDDAIGVIDQQRNFATLTLPIADYLQKAKVSEKDIKAYYEANQEQFKTPEQVSLQYVELSIPAIEKRLKFSDADLKQFYHDNLDQFTKPGRWHAAQIFVLGPAAQEDAHKKAGEKADALYAKLQKGADFSELAKANSDDKGTSDKGGDLGWLTAGILPPAEQQVLVGLKPGEVSKPVATDGGFVILKLVNLEKPAPLPFEKVQAQIRDRLAKQQAARKYADESDQLADLTYANPDSLVAASKALGLPIKTTGLFDKNGADGIAKNPKIIETAFSDDVLTEGNNSDVIQLGPDHIAVIRVKEHKAATVRPLAKVQADIKSNLMHQQAQAAAAKAGEALLKKLQKGETRVQAASETGQSWRDFNGVERHSQQVNPLALQAAFDLPKPTSKQPVYQGLQLPGGSYMVIALSKVADGSVKAVKEQERQAYKTELANNLGALDYALYAKGLYDNAKIVRHLEELED